MAGRGCRTKQLGKWLVSPVDPELIQLWISVVEDRGDVVPDGRTESGGGIRHTPEIVSAGAEPELAADVVEVVKGEAERHRIVSGCAIPVSPEFNSHVGGRRDRARQVQGDRAACGAVESHGPACTVG